MNKIRKVQKMAFIPEDVYMEWEKKNSFTTWSGWVNSMVLASINGSKDFLAQQRNKMELMEEQMSSAEYISKELNKDIKKEQVLKESSLLGREDIRKWINLWNKYRIEADITNDSLLQVKAEKIMNYLKDKGLSRAEVVNFANKDLSGGSNETE